MKPRSSRLMTRLWNEYSIDALEPDDELDEWAADWQRVRSERRRKACMPTSIEPLLDRLPTDLVLDSIAGRLNDFSDAQSAFEGYRGLAALLMANKQLNASMEVPRRAMISVCTKGILKSWTVAVPLSREDDATLGYTYLPGERMIKFPLTRRAAQSHRVVRRLEIHAPELFAAYDRMTARQQLLRETIDPSSRVVYRSGVPQWANWDAVRPDGTLPPKHEDTDEEPDEPPRVSFDHGLVEKFSPSERQQYSLTPNERCFSTKRAAQILMKPRQAGALWIRLVDPTAQFYLSMEAERISAEMLFHVTRLFICSDPSAVEKLMKDLCVDE